MSHQVQTNATNESVETLAAWISTHVEEDFVVKFTAEFEALGGESLVHLAYLREQELENIGMPALKRRKLLDAINNLPGARRFEPRYA